MKPNIESAILFTPGCASYRDQKAPDSPITLHLTEASAHRGYIASQVFNEDKHVRAVFAGGTPQVAEGWRDDQMPSSDQREAYFMAQPLQNRLRDMGWAEEKIDQRVLTQGDSNNSLGDVRLSIERGLLDPNEFNRDYTLGIHLVTGALRSVRFKEALSKALEIDPKRIRRVHMTDVYGRPRTKFHPGESAPAAIGREIAGIALNHVALHPVRPRNLHDLADAEARVTRWVSSARKR